MSVRAYSSLFLPIIRLVVALAVPLMATAAPRLQVHLEIPSQLTIGAEYQATLNVVTDKAVQAAYVKLSFPNGLEVLNGATSFRGPLSLGATQFQVRFRVSASTDGTILARTLAYGRPNEIVEGRAEILHVRADSTGLVIVSDFVGDDSSPQPQERNQRASDEQGRTRSENRSVIQERSPGRLRGELGPATAISPNSSITNRLEAGRSAVFSFQGKRGHRVWISARSNDIDTQLSLVAPNGAVVAEDDDGLGILDSRIPREGVLELSNDGTYRVVVRSFQNNEAGEFQLTVDDFTALESDLQPVASIKLDGGSQRAASSSAAAVSLSGRIVYVASDGSTVPVRYAVVRLFSQGFLFDTEVAAARSDLDGNVSLTVPDANRNDSLFVRVYATDAGIGIATVQDPLLGLHSAKRASFTLPNSTAVSFGTFNVASEGKNAPFLVYDAVVEGYLIARDVLQRTPPSVSVKFPVRSFLGLFTEPFDTDAHYLGGEITLGEFYGTSPDIVLHEYGHFVADVNGFKQTQGGPHYVPFLQRVNPSLAWGEGWASMFSVAGQNSHGKPGKRSFVSLHPNNTQNYDLENGHASAVISEAAAADDNEGSVQFILWDLFDSLVDPLPVSSGSDVVALGLKTIFDTARGGVILLAQDGSAQTYAVDYLEKFYGALLQRYSLQPDLIANVRKVVADQRILWEVPPTTPTSLRFTSDSAGVRLEWLSASANSLGYAIERKLPGQSSFSTLTSTTEPSLRLVTPTIGTSYRVYALGSNVARFIAPLVSPPSGEAVLTVLPAPPAMTVSPTQLTFDVQSNSASSPPQAVTISNSGSGNLRWQAQANVAWLSLSQGSGTAPSTLSITVNAAGLAAGAYSASITVSSADAASRTISVNAIIRPTSATSVQIDSVVSGASFGPAIAPSGWVTITGKNLARTSRIWRDSEIVGGRLPTNLDGVNVSIAGKAAFVYYVSSTQLNVQAPSDLNVQPGGTEVEVRVTSPDGSAVVGARFVPVAPALFTYLLDGQTHAAAVHPDGVLVGREGAIPGAVMREAKPGEIVLLYITGLGVNTNPAVPAGVIVTSPGVVTDPLEVTIGGIRARVAFAGLVSPGLYQINVEIPAAPAGAQSVQIRAAGVQNQGQVFLMVAH